MTTWTTEVPTEPGAYWIKYPDDDECFVDTIMDRHLPLGGDFPIGTLWSGPITPPDDRPAPVADDSPKEQHFDSKKLYVVSGPYHSMADAIDNNGSSSIVYGSLLNGL